MIYNFETWKTKDQTMLRRKKNQLRDDITKLIQSELEKIEQEAATSKEKE